jgi:uncharacterized membrane protein YphA (DoxX/SURF4 family)
VHDARSQVDGRWIRGALAFVWLATGLGVLHPHYRAVGHEDLASLGLPDLVMYGTCLGEILLGARIVIGSMSTWLAVLQVVLILGFTVILTLIDPWLLADDVLIKNLPLLALIVTAWLHEREGWSPRALWMLRSGIAAFWLAASITSLLFQMPEQVQFVAERAPAVANPAGFLRAVGVIQLLFGLSLLLPVGRLFWSILVCQILVLITGQVLLTLEQPVSWFHPFGPLTKNVPIVIGTCLVFLRAGCSESLASP